MRHLESYANEGEDAEVRGVVEIEGDCLYVALNEVGERYPIVWPASTSWDPDTGRVLLPNGESVGHGDSVYGGGGYRYVDDVEAVAGGAAADLARECVDNQYGEIAVVNNLARGIGAGDRVVNREEPSRESADPLGLDGDWLVTDLIVDGVRVELNHAWPITVTVEGEVISGTAACNQYMGAIDGSTGAGYGRFVVSELSWTEMGCEAKAMEIEQSFLTALQAVDSYEAADGLYVAKAHAATTFHLVRASPTG
jgi:heat shock protein HslJ